MKITHIKPIYFYVLPVPEVIISIITDREYMENLHRDYCFLRELERSKVAV
jgi:hypothetical protein